MAKSTTKKTKGEGSFLERVKADLKYKKHRRILKVIQARLNIERDRNEALSLHATRTSRTLYGKSQYSPRAIYDATAKDLSYRARLVEIRQLNAVQISLLTEATQALRRYVLTTYKDEMRGYANEAARKAVLERITGAALDTTVEANELINLIDHFVKDIDQAGHSIRHMIQVLDLLSSSKGKVI